MSVHTITIIIQAIIIYLSLKIYINKRKITFPEFVLLTLYLVNNVILFQTLGVVAIIGQFILLFLITFSQYRDWKNSLSTISIVLVGNILADHITTLIISMLLRIHIIESNALADNILYLSIYLILTLIIIITARVFLNQHLKLLESDGGKNIFTLGTCFMLIIFYLNIAFELVSGNSKDLITLNLLFFIIMTFIGVISIASYIQTIKRNYEIEQQKMEAKMMQTYTSELERQYTDIRKFRHDYQNILTSLEGFIIKKNYTGLDNYFFDNIKPTGQQIQQNEFILKDLMNMKLPDIKSLLANKVAVAQEKNVDVAIEISKPITSLNIERVSFIRMLGIILDNALEAQEELIDRHIHIAFIMINSSLHVIVKNNCSVDIPKLHVLKNEGFSTKGDNRGLGLTNLQDLINHSSNSELVTTIKDNQFIQTIIITNKGE